MKSGTNAAKIRQARDCLGAVAEEITRRGFYGIAVVRIKVQDGTITEVDGKTERTYKS